MNDQTGRAGIHLDGNTATVVILRSARAHPRLAEVHQARGFGSADALAHACRLLPPGLPVRVTIAATGITVAHLASGPMAPTREEFTAAAHRAFGDLPVDATVAGTLDETTTLADGARPGTVVVAPAALVADAYRALAGRAHAEVTASPLAAPWVDGTYLALRRESSELLLVRDGHTVAAHALHARGLDTAQAQSDTAAETGAAAAAAAWLSAVVDETAQVLNQWVHAGHRIDGGLFLHGRHANTAGLDELLTGAGMRRLPHPIADLPAADPLDAVDAYLAAMTLGRGLPYAAFPNTHRNTATGPTTSRAPAGAAEEAAGEAAAGDTAERSAKRRTSPPRPARRRAPLVAAAAAGVTIATCAAGLAYGTHQLDQAQAQHTALTRDPARRDAVTAAQLAETAARVGRHQDPTLLLDLVRTHVPDTGHLLARRAGDRITVTLTAPAAARAHWLRALEGTPGLRVVSGDGTPGDPAIVATAPRP